MHPSVGGASHLALSMGLFHFIAKNCVFCFYLPSAWIMRLRSLAVKASDCRCDRFGAIVAAINSSTTRNSSSTRQAPTGALSCLLRMYISLSSPLGGCT